MGYFLIVLIILMGFVLTRKNRRTSEDHGQFLAGMIGLVGNAEETFTTSGTIRVRGELWRATSRRGIIERGEQVKVVSMSDGLTVVVEKVEP